MLSSRAVTYPERGTLFNVSRSINYRYGGHIEKVRFKEYYVMPGRHEGIPFSIYERLSGHSFLKFS